MKNFSTWMIVAFMGMFWGFRIIVALAGELHWDLGGIAPLNQTFEIILLFVALASIVLVVRRKMVGGLIYLLGYGLYFGVDIINNIQVILSALEGNIDITSNAYVNIFVSLIGIILAVAVMLDLLMDKSRKSDPKDKKTDWFYKNEQYDRQFDDRADRNNYRTL